MASLIFEITPPSMAVVCVPFYFELAATVPVDNASVHVEVTGARAGGPIFDGPRIVRAETTVSDEGFEDAVRFSPGYFTFKPAAVGRSWTFNFMLMDGGMPVEGGFCSCSVYVSN